MSSLCNERMQCSVLWEEHFAEGPKSLFPFFCSRREICFFPVKIFHFGRLRPNFSGFKCDKQKTNKNKTTTTTKHKQTNKQNNNNKNQKKHKHKQKQNNKNKQTNKTKQEKKKGLLLIFIISHPSMFNFYTSSLSNFLRSSCQFSLSSLPVFSR